MESQAEDNSASTERADLRHCAIQVLTKIVNAGHVAYFAGGCVRDRLMGHEPTDYDIATSATPMDIARIFPRVQTVGESFGVMLVRVHSHVIQVATFRTEGVYSDGRHPDTVAFSDAQHDASRRDFTINGLFENPLTGEVIDYVGGKDDIEQKLVRAIGDPYARLREDRLRMLRAVRFAARFGFSIHPETADAIRTGAEHLQGVSRERIGQELSRMLTDAHRAVAAWELQSLGLDEQVLLEPSQRPALTHLSGLPEEGVGFSTALAAWLLDRHGVQAADPVVRANQWADALMLSNDERTGLRESLETYHTLMTNWSQLGIARQKRLASRPSFAHGMNLVEAIERERFIEIRRRVMDLSKSGLAPTPLIDGNDLISQGLRPGPLFSRVLEAAYDAQLEGHVHTREESLVMVHRLAQTLGN